MPYNGDGLYVEGAPPCGKDYDRHCASLVRDAERLIDRLDAIMARHPKRAHTVLYGSLVEWRNRLLVEAHEQQRANDRYDARLHEAMADATGQDEEAFYDFDR